MPSFDMAMRAKPPLDSGGSGDAVTNHRRDSQPTAVTTPNRSEAKTQPPRLIRSRRRRYLERHPSYYKGASGALELSDPLAYDRLIRQHQSAAEREAEGKVRGFARTLESSLLRGEAKLSSLRSNPGEGSNQNQALSSIPTAAEEGSDNRSKPRDLSVDWRIAVAADWNPAAPLSADMAKLRDEDQWHELITERFVQGNDDEFDYAPIDADETLDADDGVAGTWSERSREEAWFDEESPNPEAGSDENRAHLEGETGVQDF